eukprot:2644356-Rhodomonas_salina.1
MRLLVQYLSLILAEIFMYYCDAPSDYEFDAISMKGFYTFDSTTREYIFEPAKTLVIKLN